MITPRIQSALDDPSVRRTTKEILRNAMGRDCVDCVKDVALALELLTERMDIILKK